MRSPCAVRPAPRRAAAVLLAVLMALAALVSTAAPVVADPSAPRAGALRITDLAVQCECGGAGYLWGWRTVGASYAGAREGYRYRLAVARGARSALQESYGATGYVSISSEDAGFVAGRRYTFRLQEYRGKRLVRTSEPVTYRIPRPVEHPRQARFDTLTDPEAGDEVMVAGETYSITFDGAWGDGVRFASGVDRYFGTAEGDDRFGYYEEEDYPLPFAIGTRQPIVTFTPTEDMVGTTWNVIVVGYRPTKQADPDRGVRKGDPAPGSEWGYRFSVRIVAEAPAAG